MYDNHASYIDKLKSLGKTIESLCIIIPAAVKNKDYMTFLLIIYEETG